MRKNQKSGDVTRRKFLGRAVSGTAAAAVALPLAVPAQRSRQRIGKKVIYKAGEKPDPNRVYSSGIQFGQLLFVSGQVPFDPETRKLVEGPFPNQVRRCLENVKMVLEAAGSSLDRVLKCTVFLTDITNFQAMNEVYRTFFPHDPPARTTVAVRELPGDSPIEIECIASVD